jgi:hypothetical protein
MHIPSVADVIRSLSTGVDRKLTGRKRLAVDSNVHKIAIFSDELENVKQLNFSLQKFESDNIEFEKSVLIYIIVCRKKYVCDLMHITINSKSLPPCQFSI